MVCALFNVVAFLYAFKNTVLTKSKRWSKNNNNKSNKIKCGATLTNHKKVKAINNSMKKKIINTKTT